MYESFSDFFTALWQARFGPQELWEWITGVFNTALGEPVIYEMRVAISTFFAPISLFITVSLIAMGVIVAFYGKKMMPAIRFLVFALWGFAVGASCIPQYFEAVLEVPAWLCAIVMAVVHAILYRYVYYAFYTAYIAFLTYVLCYTGFTFAPPEESSVGLAVFSLIIAIIAVLFALKFRSYVEVVGTSVFGGYLVYATVCDRIYDLSKLEFLKDVQFLAPLLIILLVAVPGFILQFKMRKRYQ